MQLTKDAYNCLCIIYKEFLQRRKNGMSKDDARDFHSNYHLTNSDFYQWNQEDIGEAIRELGRNGLIKIWIDGGFQLKDECIIIMENRFKNGLKELIDVVSKFIP